MVVAAKSFSPPFRHADLLKSTSITQEARTCACSVNLTSALADTSAMHDVCMQFSLNTLHKISWF